MEGGGCHQAHFFQSDKHCWYAAHRDASKGFLDPIRALMTLIKISERTECGFMSKNLQNSLYVVVWCVDECLNFRQDSNSFGCFLKDFVSFLEDFWKKTLSCFPPTSTKFGHNILLCKAFRPVGEGALFAESQTGHFRIWKQQTLVRTITCWAPARWWCDNWIRCDPTETLEKRDLEATCWRNEPRPANWNYASISLQTSWLTICIGTHASSKIAPYLPSQSAQMQWKWSVMFHQTLPDLST